MLALVLATLLVAPQSLPRAAATPAANRSMMPTGAAALPSGSPLPVNGGGPVPGAGAMPSVPPDAAVIRNSGSTNTAGYVIVLTLDGHATVGQEGQYTTATLARPQTRWLFAKLREAGPLGALPAGHCMRSVSFGSSTTISYQGATTPDLGCAVSPLERELARTVGVIVAQLHISTFPAHRRRLL